MTTTVIPTVPYTVTPRTAADTRLRLLDESRNPLARARLITAISAGQSTLAPIRPLRRGDTNTIRQLPGQTVDFDLLVHQETQRLALGHVHYVDAQVMDLAEKLTAHPSKKPYSVHTDPPAPYGVMFFERPIHTRLYEGAAIKATEGTYAPGIHFEAPITAITWGPWTHRPAPDTRWLWYGPNGLAIPDNPTPGTWVTLYAETHADMNALDPDTPVLIDATGRTVLAHQLAAYENTTFPLAWENETVLMDTVPIGGPIPETEQNSTLHVVWTLTHIWRFINQMTRRPSSTALSVDLIDRPRPGRRRDQRAGATDGTVRVIRIGTPTTDTDTTPAPRTPGTRRSPDHCYPVMPFERNHCMNPHRHADGTCEHEIITVVEHVRGPRNTPLKPSKTVRHITP